MKVSRFSIVVLGTGSLLTGVANALPVSVDGVLGAEWAGATVKSVNYNPSAPLGNFGSPTNENHAIAYDIYTRGDANYVYVGLQTATNNATSLEFTNLYFDTNPGTGSDLLFEVQNQKVYNPSVGTPFNYTPGGQDIHYGQTLGSVSSPSTLEFAVPWSFFAVDSLGIGFPVDTDGTVQLRLSQSYGYSVAGGASYGADRLGIVAVPEPAAAAVLLVSGIGLLMRRSRRV